MANDKPIKLPLTPEQVEIYIANQATAIEHLMTALEENNITLKRHEEQLANLGPRVTTLEGKIEIKATNAGADLADRVAKMESTLKGAERIIGAGAPGANDALPSDHVLSPSRRGLADYEEARTKLVKQKPGEILTLMHLGKSIDVTYDLGRQLLRQAKVS